MQKRLFAIFLFSLFKGISSLCLRVVDPLTVSLEQFLSDLTFEILPCPFYPPCLDCPNCPNYPTYPDYPTYPSYPSPCTSCTSCTPCTCYSPNPYPYPIDQCCLDYPISYYPIEFDMTIPPCPMCLDFPCYGDNYLSRSCFRDIKDPCIICENCAPLNICYDCYDCDVCGCPYIYFPEVEYPTSALDYRPFYYGNCWA